MKMPQVELKGGIVYIDDYDPLDVSAHLKKVAGNGQASEADADEKAPAVLKGGGKGYYYVFKNGFLGVFLNEKKNRTEINSRSTDSNEILISSKGACPKPSAETGYLYRTTKSTLYMCIENRTVALTYPNDPKFKYLGNLQSASDSVAIKEVISGNKLQVLVEDPSWGDAQLWVRFGPQIVIDVVSKSTGKTIFSYIAKANVFDE